MCRLLVTPNTSNALPVIDQFGIHTQTKGNTFNINIGDIVEIFRFGDIYPSYHYAFETLWNDSIDGFHDKSGRLIREYIGYYGNRWIVKNMCVHSRYNAVLFHLKDRTGADLLIEGRSIRVIKKCSPCIQQPKALYKLKE